MPCCLASHAAQHSKRTKPKCLAIERPEFTHPCYITRPHVLLCSAGLAACMHRQVCAESCLVAGVSHQMQELVGAMLCKDPARRIDWPSLCSHPFWQSAISPLPLPPQPEFEAFLAAHSPPEEPEAPLGQVCLAEACLAQVPEMWLLPGFQVAGLCRCQNAPVRGANLAEGLLNRAAAGLPLFPLLDSLLEKPSLLLSMTLADGFSADPWSGRKPVPIWWGMCELAWPICPWLPVAT